MIIELIVWCPSDYRLAILWQALLKDNGLGYFFHIHLRLGFEDPFGIIGFA